MTRTKLLFALLLICLAPQAGAQVLDWNRVDDPLVEAIGLNMGFASGFGLSYKFPVQWWLYAQVAGGIWNNKDDARHNLGASLHYVLRQNGRDKIYLAASAAHFYHKKDGRSLDHLNYGFGVGGERLLGERTAVSVELVFTDRGDDDSVMIFPQVAGHYYF